MGIKHQNQDINSGQNPQKIFCSFQLMEGNTSISWKPSIYWHLATTDLVPVFCNEGCQTSIPGAVAGPKDSAIAPVDREKEKVVMKLLASIFDPDTRSMKT